MEVASVVVGLPGNNVRLHRRHSRNRNRSNICLFQFDEMTVKLRISSSTTFVLEISSMASGTVPGRRDVVASSVDVWIPRSWDRK